MVNIKNIIKEHIDNVLRERILCADVSYIVACEDVNISLLIDGDVDEWLDRLDVNVHRVSDINATIWYVDGSWDTYEMSYDYYEDYWIYHRYPEIPEYLHKEGE
jgi:hypothetical protein